MRVRSKRLWIGSALALLAALAVAAAMRDGEPRHARAPVSNVASAPAPLPDPPRIPAEIPARGRLLPVVSPPAAPSALARDEAMLMASLRALGLKHPERSLELAREGHALFPASPDAAERGWFVVRALVELGRFDQALAESRSMVEKYRGSPFALDVEKHLLTRPLTHATEVGYAEER